MRTRSSPSQLHDVNEAGNFADKDDDEGETAEWEEQIIAQNGRPGGKAHS